MTRRVRFFSYRRVSRGGSHDVFQRRPSSRPVTLPAVPLSDPDDPKFDAEPIRSTRGDDDDE